MFFESKHKINQPIPKEYIYHRKQYHNRLILRISWKIGESYVSISFVLDTGAPNGFYLCDQARKCLLPRIQTDDLDNDYVTVANTGNISKKIVVSPTHCNYTPANIMGLKALMFFGHIENTVYLSKMRFVHGVIPEGI